MNRTYGGHIDDRKREDINLHKDAASRIEAIYKSLGKSLVSNDDESIMKHCYHWTDSDDNKIQVIAARTLRSENGPALVVESKGIRMYSKKTRRGYHMPGRIRDSKADVIFFVLYMEDSTVRIVEIAPQTLVDYLDRFADAQRVMAKFPEDESRQARKRAIANWNSALKIDSKGKIRMVTPITVHELVSLSNKNSLLRVDTLPANSLTHSFGNDDSIEDADMFSTSNTPAPVITPAASKKKAAKETKAPVAPMVFSINIESGDTKFGTSNVSIEKVRKIVEILIG